MEAISKVITEDNLLVRTIAAEPGDGTRYQIVVIGPSDFLSLGSLGTVHDGYLVTESISGRSYLFAGHGLLHWDYVAEHLRISNMRTVIVLTQMMADALGRPYALPQHVEAQNA